MPRRLFLLTAAAVTATAAVAAPTPQAGWGKAGVSYQEYRQDALDCANEGLSIDVSDSADAKAFVKASRELDALTEQAATSAASSSQADAMVQNANDQGRVVDSLRVSQRLHNIKLMVGAAINQCLVGRGYSRFLLTDDQRKQFEKLKSGSDEKRHYLYSLASDPAVLSQQRAPTQQ
jgi:hypothetical protein